MDEEVMPKPPRPAALEVLRHNLLILAGLPSRNLVHAWGVAINNNNKK